jgi:hypothetical protein
MAAQLLLFVIVGKNEPLYEAEFVKAGAVGSSDSVTRQNYFVLHSALDLVEKAAWTSNNMYLKVVDKVSEFVEHEFRQATLHSYCTICIFPGQPPASINIFDGRKHQVYATPRRSERGQHQEFFQRRLRTLRQGKWQFLGICLEFCD